MKLITNKKNRISIAARALVAIAVFVALGTQAFAYSIEQLPNVGVSSDFVVGPGKQELTLNPGETRTLNFTVTNRMGEDKVFQIGIEDFEGSRDVTQTVVLLGNQRGPYSLKDYISVPEKTFILKHGERATVPVTISIPADAEAGGKYGSVVVSTVSRAVATSTSGAQGGAAIISRIGTLIFLTVPGNVAKAGSLKDFKIAGDKKFFVAGPVNFQLLFENTGAIHLDPYGEIDIKNMLGEQVAQINLDPWFALPDSLRLREATWDRGTLFGIYTATAKINRGYDNIIDEKTVTFYAIPWKYAAAIFAGVFFLILLWKMVLSKFELKKK